MKITLKDGAVGIEGPMSALEVVKRISNSLAKQAVAVRINGKVMDLTTPIHEDVEMEVLTFADPDGAKVLRHTASHVMAQAVKRIRPDAKLAIGPAIDNGFYYDFDLEEPFSTEDFAKIEKEMAKIVQANEKLERFELPREEAIALMESQGQSYKVELIRDLPEDAVISFYKQGDFVDLCAGPHLPSTGRVKAFKLLSVAGAYWRGSEKNRCCSAFMPRPLIRKPTWMNT